VYLLHQAAMSTISLVCPQKQFGHLPVGQLPPHVSLLDIDTSKVVIIKANNIEALLILFNLLLHKDSQLYDRFINYFY
jgi:hypothetical protein